MLGVRLEVVCCSSDDIWVSDTELWLLKLDEQLWQQRLQQQSCLLLCEVVVLFPCSAVAASAVDVMEGPPLPGWALSAL